jgi:hypothetical protein
MIDRIGLVPVVEGRDFQGFVHDREARSETGSCVKNQLSITLRHQPRPDAARGSRASRAFTTRTTIRRKTFPLTDETA